MEPLIVATLVTVDDWAALYIGDTLASGVEQNHSLDLRAVLEAVTQEGCNGFDSFEVTEDYAEEIGRFPENLADIPEHVRIVS